MSKAFQLSIPKPCHENWEQMAPDDKGRFCGSCQKQVVDFTGMSDCELIAFFKKPSTGSVCGRFNNTQLEHDFEIPRKRIPWLKYFFTIALPAFFATTKATAQGEVVKGKASVKIVPDKSKPIQPSQNLNCELRKPITEFPYREIIMGDTIPQVVTDNLVEIEKRTIEGRVLSDEGEPLAHASVLIKGTKTGTVSDIDGNFKLIVPQTANILVVSYIGYSTVEATIDSNSKKMQITLASDSRYFTVGIIVSTATPKKKSIPLIPQIFKDTAFKNFKFYPNPAIQGSVITLEWKKAEKGEFEVQLLNQQGQIVNRKSENFTEKLNSIQYTIPHVTPGSYFLVLVNRKSGKKITEKIIVQ